MNKAEFEILSKYLLYIPDNHRGVNKISLSSYLCCSGVKTSGKFNSLDVVLSNIKLDKNLQSLFRKNSIPENLYLEYISLVYSYCHKRGCVRCLLYSFIVRYNIFNSHSLNIDLFWTSLMKPEYRRKHFNLTKI